MEDFQFELSLLADFVGENWASFVAFMEARDADESGCDDLINRLEQLAGR